MPKTLIAGTLYLITVQSCSCPNMAEPFRLYANRGKADKFMNRLKLHYSRKPESPGYTATEQESGEWYAKLMAWQHKHPGGLDNCYVDLGAWSVRPMSVC